MSISNTNATVSRNGQLLNYHRVWPYCAVRVAWPVVRRGLTLLYGPPQPLLELWPGSNIPVRRPTILRILKLVTSLPDLCRFINPVSAIHNARSEITRSWSINMSTPTRCFIIIARLCYAIFDPRVLVLLLFTVSRHSAAEDITHILWTLVIHYYIHTRPPLVLISSQMSPIQLLFYFVYP